VDGSDNGLSLRKPDTRQYVAASSIIGNYAYADGNMTFLGAKVKVLSVFRIVAILAVFGGSVGELPTVWAMAALADYEAGEPKGLPHFAASGNRHMPGALPTEVWRCCFSSS
jgi:AGCS family alanine or glycine:cation symporter